MFNSNPLFSDDPALTRRAALQRSAVGFGSLAMASMLAERSAVADPGSNRSVIARAASSRASETHHFSLHERRTVAGRYVRSKPLLTRDDGKPLPFAKPECSSTRPATC